MCNCVLLLIQNIFFDDFSLNHSGSIVAPAFISTFFHIHTKHTRNSDKLLFYSISFLLEPRTLHHTVYRIINVNFFYHALIGWNAQEQQRFQNTMTQTATEYGKATGLFHYCFFFVLFLFGFGLMICFRIEYLKSVQISHLLSDESSQGRTRRQPDAFRYGTQSSSHQSVNGISDFWLRIYFWCDNSLFR